MRVMAVMAAPFNRCCELERSAPLQLIPRQRPLGHHCLAFSSLFRASSACRGAGGCQTRLRRRFSAPTIAATATASGPWAAGEEPRLKHGGDTVAVRPRRDAASSPLGTTSPASTGSPAATPPSVLLASALSRPPLPGRGPPTMAPMAALVRLARPAAAPVRRGLARLRRYSAPAAGALPLDGFRVLDMTRVLAGVRGDPPCPPFSLAVPGAG